MQSTGHASVHARSLVPMQGSAITYAISYPSPSSFVLKSSEDSILATEILNISQRLFGPFADFRPRCWLGVAANPSNAPPANKGSCDPDHKSSQRSSDKR